MPSSFPFALLGKKLGMTQFFNEDGSVTPVTAIELGPCPVLQKKTPQTDGYWAVQIGFDDKKKQRVNKAEAGHAKASGSTVKRFIREIRLDEKSAEQYELGQVLTAALLKEGDKVDISGRSMGKGYQGVMRRYNFAGMPATHGTHEFFRHGGSIGNCTKPGKVIKGRKMPGQMGNKNVTTQNITVYKIDSEKNIVFVKGAVPGHKNGYIELKASVKGGFAARDLKPAPEAPATEETTEASAE